MHMSSFVVVVRAKNRENKLDWNDSWRLYLIYMEMKRLPVFLVNKKYPINSHGTIRVKWSNKLLWLRISINC